MAVTSVTQAPLCQVTQDKVGGGGGSVGGGGVGAKKPRLSPGSATPSWEP